MSYRKDREYDELGMVRKRQYTEAKRVVELAFNAGLFDDLDPVERVRMEPTGPAQWAMDALLVRAGSRAQELLAGQYPEVKVTAVPRLNGWPVRERPRCRMRVEVRPRLHSGLRSTT